MTTVRFRLDPHDPPVPTHEERRRLEGLTGDAVESAAIDDPDNPPATDEELARAVLGRRVRRVRESLALTQADFARTYRIPLATLRDWEQSRRSPDAAALAYLTVIEREPEAVARALAAA